MKEKSFCKVFSIACLLTDVVKNTPSWNKNGGRLYELQIITKKDIDPEKIHSFFVERSGRVPAVLRVCSLEA